MTPEEREAHNAYQRQWRKSRPLTDEQRQAARVRWQRWYETHRQEKAARQRRIATENREKIRAYDKAWRASHKKQEPMTIKIETNPPQITVIDRPCANQGCPNLAREHSKYCSRRCRNKSSERNNPEFPEKRKKYRKTWRENNKKKRAEYQREWRAEHAEQVELFPAKKAKKKCTCNDYRHCMECRNREKRAAFKQDRIPVYRLAAMQPAAQQAGD
jgi:hypothetical protein